MPRDSLDPCDPGEEDGMQLDDVTVRHVERAGIAPTAPRGDWQCCSCGNSYPVADGWKVFYDTVPGVMAVAYVCPACAGAASRD